MKWKGCLSRRYLSSQSSLIGTVVTRTEEPESEAGSRITLAPATPGSHQLHTLRILYCALSRCTISDPSMHSIPNFPSLTLVHFCPRVSLPMSHCVLTGLPFPFSHPSRSSCPLASSFFANYTGMHLYLSLAPTKVPAKVGHPLVPPPTDKSHQLQYAHKKLKCRHN